MQDLDILIAHFSADRRDDPGALVAGHDEVPPGKPALPGTETEEVVHVQSSFLARGLESTRFRWAALNLPYTFSIFRVTSWAVNPQTSYLVDLGAFARAPPSHWP
jgi:hypothetical protein